MSNSKTFKTTCFFIKKSRTCKIILCFEKLVYLILDWLYWALWKKTDSNSWKLITDSKHYLLIAGKFKTTSKNFSRTTNKALSATAGLGPKLESPVSVMPFPESFEPTIPFVATLCFFKKAAEKPEAQTYTKQRLELLSHWILRIRNGMKTKPWLILPKVQYNHIACAANWAYQKNKRIPQLWIKKKVYLL